MASITTPANLQGLKVVSFESRRAKEMAELIRRYGGEPVVAPSMREIPLEENRAALEFLPELEAGAFDVVVFMTGVGTRTLHQALLTRYPAERVVAALKQARLATRGPKPAAVLRELGLSAELVVPEPNTWREVLATLDAADAVQDRSVAIQEYGLPNPELVCALERRGARVKTIAIYRWGLPEELEPLRQAIQLIISGSVHAALFTNGAQVEHLFRVASETKAAEGLRRAFDRLAIGSVGPICSQALGRFGLKPDIEPAHPKMGALIAEFAAGAKRVLSEKPGAAR